ncbi:MAG: hypothetical protein Q4C13_08145, partial [Clostridia bacterium]|nr:hypothetical protein [Clostridia bacterium]
LLLGASLALMRGRRYIPACLLLLAGALLSAFTLGYVKLCVIGSEMGVFSMLGVGQFWLDFLVALMPAALVVLCGALSRREAFAAMAEPCAGGAVSICCLLAMLLSMPRLGLLPVVFAVFSSLVFGAFVFFASRFAGRILSTPPKARMRPGPLAAVWFSFCFPVSLAAAVMIMLADDHCQVLFTLCLLIAQIVGLILLLCGRRSGFYLYAASTAAVFLMAFMYFLLAYVVSESWTPILLVGGIVDALGPAVGWLILRKRWDMPMESEARLYA